MGNKASTYGAFPTEASTAEGARVLNTVGPLFTKALAIHTARCMAAEAIAAGSLTVSADVEVQNGASADASDGGGGQPPASLLGAARAAGPEFYLESPPLATEPLERGWLTKLGEVNKNWKRRFFVATAAADNFLVYYFEREEHANDRRKAKGVISLCGYIARPVAAATSGSAASPEAGGSSSTAGAGSSAASSSQGPAAADVGSADEAAAAAFGAHGICLQPIDRKRRWYYLHCESGEQQRRWMSALKHGCLHAIAPCVAPIGVYPRTLVELSGYRSAGGEGLSLLEAAYGVSAHRIASLAQIGSCAPVSSTSSSAVAAEDKDPKAKPAQQSPPIAAPDLQFVTSLAFQDAYQHARSQLGLSGYHVLDRNQREQIAALIMTSCESENGPLGSIYSQLSSVIDNAVVAAAGGVAGLTIDGAGADWNGDTATSKIPAPSAKDIPRNPADAERVRSTMDAALEKLALQVTDSAWTSILARGEMQQDAIGKVINANLQGIVQASISKRSAFRKQFGEQLKGIAVKELERIAPLVIGSLLNPLYKAHKEGIRVFWSRIHEILDRGLREVELRSFYKDVEWQTSSLAPALQRIRAITRAGRVGGIGSASSETSNKQAAGSAAASAGGKQLFDGTAATADTKVLKALAGLPCTISELVSALGPVTMWEFEAEAETGIRENIGRAVYTFVLRVETSRGAAPPSVILAQTVQMMLSDADTRMRCCFRNLLMSILLGRVRNSAVSSISELRAALKTGSVAWGSPDFTVLAGPPAANPLSTMDESSASAAESASGAGAAPAKDSANAAWATSGKAVVNKRNRAAVEAEVAAAASTPEGAANIFCDAEWTFTDVLIESIDTAIAGVCGPQVQKVLSKLEKLNAKLGFD